MRMKMLGLSLHTRVWISFLLGAVFLMLGAPTYAQECSDQQCEYTLSFDPSFSVINDGDGVTAGLEVYVNKEVSSTCGYLATGSHNPYDFSYWQQYIIPGGLEASGYVDSIRVSTSLAGTIQNAYDIPLSQCTFTGTDTQWQDCMYNEIHTFLFATGGLISGDNYQLLVNVGVGDWTIAFKNNNVPNISWAGIDADNFSGVYIVSGGAGNDDLGFEVYSSAAANGLGVNGDIPNYGLSYTGNIWAIASDLKMSLSGDIIGLDIVDQSTLNFNVIEVNTGYMLPSVCTDGNTCFSPHADNHSETVVESGSVDACGTCIYDPAYEQDLDEDGLLDLCEDNFVEVFDKTYDIANQKIYYTVQAFIPEGVDIVHFDDQLGAGTGIASINTGTIQVVAATSGDINWGNLIWTGNIAGNVESFSIDIEETNGYTGGVGIIITYEVDVLEQGVVCNVCDLTDNTDPGGIAWYQDWLAQSAYAQVTYGSTGICVFVPMFDKEIVQETSTGVTYRLSGTIGTGQTYEVNDQVPAGTIVPPLQPQPQAGVSYSLLAQTSNSFSYQITNNSSSNQTWAIVFTVDITGQTEPVCNQGVLEAYGESYTILLESDNPDTPLSNYDATCACPAGTNFVNGNCVTPPATCTDLPSNAVVCSGPAPLMNTSYTFDDGCVSGMECRFECADGYIWDGDNCVALCTGLPAGAIACPDTLDPVSQQSFGTNYTGDCDLLTTPPDFCWFTCPAGTTWDGSACIAHTCDDTLLPENASYCNPSLLPPVDNQAPELNVDCEPMVEACDFDCDEGYEWEWNPWPVTGSCVLADALIKEASVSVTGLITYEIRGYVAADTEIVTIEDVITGGVLLPATVIVGNFSTSDNLTVTDGPTVNGGNTGFTMEVTNGDYPTDGGMFTFIFQAELDPVVPIPEICNEAMMFSGATVIAYSDDPATALEPDLSPETHDPTCVTGYDLEMTKYVYPTWPASTYPENIAYGEVYNGDWFVYHIEVTNNGPFPVSGAIVSDVLPTGVTAFWHENPQPLISGLTFLPANGDDPAFPGAEQFLREIQGTLEVGQSTGFDLFATLDNAGPIYATGDQICNVADAYVEGDPTYQYDRNPSDNFDARNYYDDACLTMTDSCIRTCEGELYATGFVWTVSGNTLTVDATCISEATCGDSDEFAAIPAELVYGTSSINATIVGGLFSFSLPSDTTGGNDLITVDVNVCAGNPTCIQSETLAEIQLHDRYDSVGSAFDPDDFQNYNLLGGTFSVVGSDVSFDVQTRTIRHRLSCLKETNSCHDDMYRTYEIDPLEWLDLNEFTNPVNQNLYETPNLEHVRNRPTEPLNNHTVGGTCDTCNNSCGEMICEVCPAGSLLFITNIGGELVTECQCPDGTPAVDVSPQDGIADNCGPGIPTGKTGAVAGNTITYTITGYGDVGYNVLYVTDTFTGNAIFVTGSANLTILEGSGSLGAVSVTGNQLSIQINNLDINQAVWFVLEYQIEVLDTSLPVCNQASFATGSTSDPYLITDDVTTPESGDATCGCTDGLQQCGSECVLPGECVPEFEKVILATGEDGILYQINGMVPGQYGAFSLVDTMTGGDHPSNPGDYQIMETGSGEVEVLIDNPDAMSITISGHNEELPDYTFSITYTGTVAAGRDVLVDGSICNQLSGTGVDMDDPLCECPGTIICELDTSICVTDPDDCTPGDPEFEKTIIGQTATGITYQISGSVPAGYGAFSFIDTMSGADHPSNPGDYLIVETGSGEVEVLIDNPDAMSITISGNNIVWLPYTFTITYTALVTSDPFVDGAVCNQLAGTGTDVTPVCDCLGSIICPDQQTCVMNVDDCTPGDPEFEKTILATGNGVIVYQISGNVPAGYGAFSLTDTLTGGDHPSTSTGYEITETGSGEVEVLIDNPDAMSITISGNNTVWLPYAFTIVYTGTMGTGWDPLLDGAICNQLNGAIGVDMDEPLCACPDTFIYCEVDDEAVCVTDPDDCTPGEPEVEKTIIATGDGYFVYQISGSVPAGYAWFEFTDTMTGGNHPDLTGDYQVVGVGSGTIEIFPNLPTSNDVWFIVMNPYWIPYSFTITYTGTVDLAWNPLVDGPICNTLNASGTDMTVCDCPDTYILCDDSVPVDDMTCVTDIIDCPNTGEPEIIKTVDVDYAGSGDTIVYTITLTNPSTGNIFTGITLVDFLPDAIITGEFAPPADLVTPTVSGTIYTWTGITLNTGESIDYIFTGQVGCGSSGCPTSGQQICNTAQLLIDDILPGPEYEVQACFIYGECSTNSECSSGEVCDMGTCVENNFCTSFDVSPNAGTSSVNATYTCIGTGNSAGVVFAVTGYDDDGAVYVVGTSTTGMTIGGYIATGTLAFGTIGEYEVVCSFNGDTGLTCNGQAMNLAQAMNIVTGTMAQIFAESGTNYPEYTGGTCGLDWQAGFVTGTDLASYLDLSAEGLQDTIATDIVFWYMPLYALDQGCTFGSPPPLGLPLHTRITNSVAGAMSANSCTELCVDTVEVSPPGGGCSSSIETCDDGIDNDCDGEIDEGCDGGDGYCGDGIVDAGEECDDGNNTNGDGCSSTCDDEGGGGGHYCGDGEINPGEYCDDGNNVNGDGCSSTCRNEGGGGGGGGGGDTIQVINGEEPKCAWVDPPSIQVGEYLPFWWDIEMGNLVDEDAASCSELANGKSIPGETMYCTFEIYNGSSSQPILTMNDIPCWEDQWQRRGITAFYDVPGANNTQYPPLGRNFVKITEEMTDGILGEYQLVLKEINYVLCDGEEEQLETLDGLSNERICSMNFAVSEGYLIHQGSAMATLPNTDLRDFRYLDGRMVANSQQLSQISDTKLSTYQEGSIDYLIDTFVQKYDRLAVQERTLPSLTQANLRKTASSNIYVYDGGTTRTPLTLAGGIYDGSASTIIVRQADLIVRGSLQGNTMYIVPDGHIIFENTNCDLRDIVQGIFITKRGFTTSVIENSSLAASSWCDDGRLTINGMLIGPGVTNINFIGARRAVLQDWFNVSHTTQETKIFDGASLLMKTNASLWNSLPPGATDLTEAMVIYK